MRYVEFGRTDLDVSAICFGTWQAGGDWGAPQEEDLKAAIRRALDLGINFFDTAQRPTGLAPPSGSWEFSLLECGLGVVRAAGSRLPLRSPLRPGYAEALSWVR